MRKTCMLLVVLLLAAALAACGADAESGAAPAASPTVSPSLSDDYLTWTKEDWERASAEQQTGAARFVLFRIGDAFMPNFSEMVDEAGSDTAMQEQLDQSVETLKQQIGNFFEQAADKATLNEMVSAAEGLIS